MTTYLKSCWGWVVVAVIINLILLGSGLHFNDEANQLIEQKNQGIVVDLENCDYTSESWQKALCKIDDSIQWKYNYIYFLIAVHFVIDIRIFFWLNEREHWVGWISCDEKRSHI